MIKPKDVPFPIGYGPATYKAHGQDPAFKGGEYEYSCLRGFSKLAQDVPFQ